MAGHGREIMSQEREESASPIRTSLPSTELASPRPDSDDFTRLEVASPVDALDETAASLEGQLQAEREGRNQERFYWIAGMSVLIDVIAYKVIDSAFGFILIFVLQLAILTGLAAKLGVDKVAVLLGQLYYILTRRLERHKNGAQSR
jgi:hypothetical protein